jgi:hypothetical protein
MKSDVFHAYDPTSMRDSVLGVRMSRSPLTIINPSQSSVPQIGYKLPLSSDLVRYSTWLERRNDDIQRKATPCRICPQYGHALIFPRKCYYEIQCPLPLLFCVHQHREREEKAVKTTLVLRHRLVHPTQNFLRRLSSTLSKKIAYNDPTRENTNFGWRKKV